MVNMVINLKGSVRMFDYSNLSPNEFEILCADILSRELGVNLRYFSPGRDGGVDLTDSPTKKNFVVQVKHYNSSFSNLKTSLVKELDKLKEMKPKPQKYYICTSKQLTASNIKEIFELFSEYMEDDKNIFTKAELDNFLNADKNKDILRKNFKLWLVSDKVLTQLITRDVLIDGEVLLDNLEEDFKYFVQTSIFDECIQILEKEHKLLICGDPGVGKSINSKMLAFYFVKKGYQIRYSTNGMISDLKKSLQDNKDLKEVLFLDDCLGQYYLKLKDMQDRELISLMKYIELSENKILILNSRITVLNEAQVQSRSLKQYIEDEKVQIHKINMNNTKTEEKAMIFYNHLVKNRVPNSYYNSIRRSKNYRKIINHTNYNPRIIEYVTHRRRYQRIKPADYNSYIISMLDNPKEAWAEEFRIGLGVEDRIFMHTLFSLTDTLINIDILEECFVSRIKNEPNIDHTTNKFEEAQLRLTSSLIRIVDTGGEIKVGVLNPSINDYMKHSLSTHRVEVNNIVHHAIYMEQIEKVLKENAADKINQLLLTGDIVNKKSIENKLPIYIINSIANNKIMLAKYKAFIQKGLSLIKKNTIVFGETISKQEILKIFLRDKDLFAYYEIGQLLDDKYMAQSLAAFIDIQDLTSILSLLKAEDLDNKDVFWYLLDEYITKASEYLESIDLIDVVEDSIDDIVEIYHKNSEKMDYTEYEKAVKGLEGSVRGLLLEEIFDLMISLSDYGIIEEVKKDLLKIINTKINDELDEILNWQIENQPDDDYPEYDRESHNESLGGYDLDLILDRDIGE